MRKPVLTLILCAMLAAGCENQGGSNTSGGPGPKALVQSAAEVAAVTLLEKAGVSLKKTGEVVTEVAFSSDDDATELLKNLSALPNVTTIRLGGPGMSDKALQSLSSLGNLKRLDLTDSANISDETLKTVGSLANLEVLILRRCGFTDAGLAHVTTLKKLRAIDLRNTNTSDAGVAHLSGLKSLVDVQLEKTKVTNACLNSLKDLPLKSLNLNYDTEITDTGLEVICTITTLEQLQMEACRITDAGMPSLAKLKKLKRFGCRQADVTGAGFAHLAGLTELTRLELRETSMDDEGLLAISVLPKLQFLDISECRLVTADGIPHIAKLTTLDYLELREVKKVKDECFASLETLVNLTELNLEATRVTSESAPVLLRMVKLERLSLSGSNFDDAGLTQLAQHPTLKVLDLTNCSVTPEAVSKLREARPGLEIKTN